MTNATGALGTHCGNVRSFTNNMDYTDDQITLWTRFAEEGFNDDLRDISMHRRSNAAVQNNIIQLPTDWLETIWLRFVGTPSVLPPPLPLGTGYTDTLFGKPLRCCTPDEFFTITNDPNHSEYLYALYMINGTELFLNPALAAVNGQIFEMGYYGRIPPLGTPVTPLYQKSMKLYTYATCAAAAMFEIEDDRVPTWEAYVSKKITSMNEATQRARHGGGPLHARKRSFG